MSLQILFLIVAAVVVLVVLPVVMVLSIVEHFRHKGSERERGTLIFANQH
ncbi:MAG: hypothetical protein WD669_02820 [Pirellulales bacterium]